MYYEQHPEAYESDDSRRYWNYRACRAHLESMGYKSDGHGHYIREGTPGIAHIDVEAGTIKR